jgi:hypothetical protein
MKTIDADPEVVQAGNLPFGHFGQGTLGHIDGDVAVYVFVPCGEGELQEGPHDTLEEGLFAADGHTVDGWREEEVYGASVEPAHFAHIIEDLMLVEDVACYDVEPPEETILPWFAI